MKDLNLDENYINLKSRFFSYAFDTSRNDYFSFNSAKRFLETMECKFTDDQLKNIINICGKQGWLDSKIIYEPTFLLMSVPTKEIEDMVTKLGDPYLVKVAKALKNSEKQEHFTLEDFVAQNYANKKDTSKIEQIFELFEKADYLKKKYVFFPQEKFFKDNKNYKFGKKYAPADEFLMEKR